MKRSLVVSLFLVSHLVLLSGFSWAQPLCPLAPPIDDGFAVGCCAPPVPLLPVPPPTLLTCDWGVFTNCNLGYTNTCTVALGSPNWALCDAAVIPMSISGFPGVPPVTTFLVAKYVRTWEEPDAAGLPMNVWRLLINCDIPFQPSTACPAGSCLPPSTGAPYLMPAHFVGHIDYACDSTVPGNWVTTLSLSHLPGCLMHAPYSTRPIPALATSDSSYHLVGPAPFVFGPAPEPQGLLTGDSSRSSTLFTTPLTYFCHGESERFLGGSLTTLNADCFCGPLANGPWRHQNFVATFDCVGQVSTFASLPVLGTPLAQTGFATFTLGHWNTGGVFPQNRDLMVYIGVITSGNFTCSPVAPSPFQVVTGVGTTSAVPGQPFSSLPGTPPGPPARSFIDLQNMLPLSLWAFGGGLGIPGLGSLFLPDQVLSVNIP